MSAPRCPCCERPRSPPREGVRTARPRSASPASRRGAGRVGLAGRPLAEGAAAAVGTPSAQSAIEPHDARKGRREHAQLVEHVEAGARPARRKDVRPASPAAGAAGRKREVEVADGHERQPRVERRAAVEFGLEPAHLLFRHHQHKRVRRAHLLEPVHDAQQARQVGARASGHEDAGAARGRRRRAVRQWVRDEARHRRVARARAVARHIIY
eukprot:4069183-Prymnesium_polylepis.2